MDTLNRYLNEGLLSELECPVCVEYMLPPIELCGNGHNICSGCKSKLKECPTCRQPFVNIRNLALENIARKVKYPCTNRKFGCKETCFLDFITDHQAVCAYAPYVCPFVDEKTCAWADAQCHLKEHLLKGHAEDVREQNGATYLIINTDSTVLKGCKIVFAHNEIFCVHIQRRLRSYYIAVRYIGAPENASKYAYKIRFSKWNSVESIVVCHVSRSFTEKVDEIFESGNCFKLPCELLKRFVIHSTNLPYKLEIFKVCAVNSTGHQ
jgi:E3 ubiquitin-protein ligase SIAH1